LTDLVEQSETFYVSSFSCYDLIDDQQYLVRHADVFSLKHRSSSMSPINYGICS